ncbi:MAG TPA: class I SAM-dependent methyltransferase [Gaiellaceae bacterium]|nr:class I SAM-dependent methyltransferase [Gaiellaceae bacterium]
MGCCAPPRGYTKLFSRRTARRDARRYRRRGLDDTARWMVAYLDGSGLEGASVLEIGGGVGAVQIDLLEAGAERATNVELSPEYEEEAAALVREHGLEERVERRLGDVVQAPALAGEADAVVMHRVVCCYPDYDALVGAAAERARRRLVMSFPRPRLLVRLGMGAVNAGARLLRWEYRTWVHPPEALVAAAESRGLRLASEWSGPIWQAAALERPGSSL